MMRAEMDVRRLTRDLLAGAEEEAADLERSGTFPWRALAQLRAAGLFGLPFPEAVGGLGRGWLAATALIEEASQLHAAIGAVLDIQMALVAAPLVQFATAEQGNIVRDVVRGGALAAFALTEEGAGSDPRGMQTVARRDGDGYRLEGHKLFISNADVATWLLTFALVDRRPTAFVVERQNPDLAVGPPLRKMGMRSVGTHRVDFRGVYVPSPLRLGAEGEGLHIANFALSRGRLGIASQALGIGEAAFVKARDHVAQRRQFGKALAEFQFVQMTLAEMRLRLRSAQLLCEDAARRLDAGEDVSADAALAKVAASEAATFVADRALQLFGGYGYMEEYSVERYLREARVTEIYEGTSEINRLIVARDILRPARREIGGTSPHAR
ncbi:MAG: acyl-CoA dehydrogenase family protein [Thermaerobacter sp.]|nr:acyl-CoA dehydrogenase family protein [Thermaerobacter sp.]